MKSIWYRYSNILIKWCILIEIDKIRGYLKRVGFIKIDFNVNDDNVDDVNGGVLEVMSDDVFEDNCVRSGRIGNRWIISIGYSLLMLFYLEWLYFI